MRFGRVVLAITTAATVGLVSLTVPTAATSSSAKAGKSASLGAVLVGGNEVPGPGDPNGFGLADVKVKRAEVCWRITVKDVEPITAAHIHAGPEGVAGPVVVPLEPFDAGCADVETRTARFLRQHPEQFYVNLHNAEFPAGAVRGQLLR